MSGVWSRILAPASRWIRHRRGIKTSNVTRGGGNKWVDGGYGDTIGTLRIEPTKWEDKKVLDDIMFHAVLVATPLALISAYVNIFIGPAKLTPIPEGYEPKEEEYEVHPIPRFFKSLQRTEQQQHEQNMHFHWQKWRETHKAQLIAEVRRQMKVEGDYASYYYTPTTAKYSRQQKKDRDDAWERTGNH